MKRAFKYRFYPNSEQAAELARTFECVRLVYNMALPAEPLDIVWSRPLPDGAAPSTVTVFRDQLPGQLSLGSRRSSP
ncbi:helix-turn-helix domain-containing protein [Paractinoplanes rishiriensis]|nr:helix-turn-helix domain-containing protein [Actinoplanes rishiriensis]